MKGIEEGYDLPPEASANIFELTDEERAAEGLEPLPQSLSDALAAMEKSELVAEALGEHIFEWFLRNKRHEWRGYKTQVTPFEIDRYLRHPVSEALVMEPILVFPDPPPPSWPRRSTWPATRGRRPPRSRAPAACEPADGWAGAVVVADTDPEVGVGVLPHRAQEDVPLAPLLLLVSGAQLADLELRDDLFDDFCLAPVPPPRARGPPQAPLLEEGRRHPTRAGRVRRRWCSTWRPTRPT